MVSVILRPLAVYFSRKKVLTVRENYRYFVQNQSEKECLIVHDKVHSMDSSNTNNDDDECTQKNFFKFPHIHLDEHAQCQHLLAGTTPCRKDFYYYKKRIFANLKTSLPYDS